MRLGIISDGQASCLLCNEWRRTMSDSETHWDLDKKLKEHLREIHERILVSSSIQGKKSGTLILSGVDYPSAFSQVGWARF